MTIEIIPINEEPVVWEPEPELAELAFRLHNELIRLGEEVRPAREKVIETYQKQGRILAEFYLNDELCKALGCEGGWDEYKMQEDVIEALGFNPIRMSRASYSRDCRLAIHSYYSGLPLLEDGTKTRIGEALSKLDGLLEDVREAETPEEQEAAHQEYMEAVTHYADMTSREVRREVAKHRQPPCTLLYHHVPRWEAELYQGDELAATVKLIDPLAYYVVSRLTRESLPQFRYDENGIGYYDEDGEFVYVLKFMKRLPEKTRRKMAEAIPYCTRR